MPERGLEIIMSVILTDERGAQRSGRAGIAGLLRHRLVGDECGLHNDASLRSTASTS